MARTLHRDSRDRAPPRARSPTRIQRAWLPALLDVRDKLVRVTEFERARLIQLLDDRVAVFNREAKKLAYPRYEGGFFVSVFTKDGEACAASMREDGVFVVPMKGAVRVALCSTAVRDVPRLVRALEKGMSRAGQ